MYNGVKIRIRRGYHMALSKLKKMIVDEIDDEESSGSGVPQRRQESLA